MEEIIQEKISADHLLYVSLKYTKTCDIIMNLLIRWRRLIELSIEKILIHAKKKKKISSIPTNPISSINEIKKLFSKDKDFLEVISLYEMFRKLKELKTERIGEFRKNVTLKIFYQGKEIDVNLEKLKQYANLMDKYVNKVKAFLSS